MIETYEEIYEKLQKNVNACVKFYKEHPEDFNAMLEQQKNGKNIERIRSNRFIQEKNRLSEVKKQYTSRDYLEGELGTVDEIDQLDGITNLALLAVCANRITKFSKSKENKDRSFYHEKDEAMSSLLASIFVLENTSEEYQDFFMYGNTRDANKNMAFILNLPYFGQIGLHYGVEMKKQAIVQRAKEKATSILE